MSRPSQLEGHPQSPTGPQIITTMIDLPLDSPTDCHFRTFCMMRSPCQPNCQCNKQCWHCMFTLQCDLHSDTLRATTTAEASGKHCCVALHALSYSARRSVKDTLRVASIERLLAEDREGKSYLEIWRRSNDSLPAGLEKHHCWRLVPLAWSWTLAKHMLRRQC